MTYLEFYIFGGGGGVTSLHRYCRKQVIDSRWLIICVYIQFISLPINDPQGRGKGKTIHRQMSNIDRRILV